MEFLSEESRCTVFSNKLRTFSTKSKCCLRVKDATTSTHTSRLGRPRTLTWTQRKTWKKRCAEKKKFSWKQNCYSSSLKPTKRVRLKLWNLKSRSRLSLRSVLVISLQSLTSKLKIVKKTCVKSTSKSKKIFGIKKPKIQRLFKPHQTPTVKYRTQQTFKTAMRMNNVLDAKNVVMCVPKTRSRPVKASLTLGRLNWRTTLKEGSTLARWTKVSNKIKSLQMRVWRSLVASLMTPEFRPKISVADLLRTKTSSNFLELVQKLQWL